MQYAPKELINPLLDLICTVHCRRIAVRGGRARKVNVAPSARLHQLQLCSMVCHISHNAQASGTNVSVTCFRSRRPRRAGEEYWHPVEYWELSPGNLISMPLHF